MTHHTKRKFGREHWIGFVAGLEAAKREISWLQKQAIEYHKLKKRKSKK